MKKSKILRSIAMLTGVLALTLGSLSAFDAEAQRIPTKHINNQTCYDNNGNESGSGNTCVPGEGNCMPNPCGGNQQ